MRKFNKIILWGYKLYSHTNSFIYAGFKKAFEHMGYDAKWYFDEEDHSAENFNDCLFFAFEGQERNIPLNKTSRYILHNINPAKYIDAGCKVLSIQTFNKDVFAYDNIIKLSNCTGYLKGEISDIVFMPWATNLLPGEFNFDLPKTRFNQCVWIGTFGDFTGTFQNGRQLQPFFDQCTAKGIPVIKIDPWGSPVSFEENYDLVRSSKLAPTIQGEWQVTNQYVTCRIFKNISYGNLGITNSKTVDGIFDGQIIYAPDSIDLFNKSIEAANSDSVNENILSAMEEVKNNHTYINRINLIFEYLP